MTTLFDFSAETLVGKERSLSDFRGKVVMVVNTASRCGFTPQYEALEHLYRERREAGLVVLGFPCNQFGKQEPGDAADIAAFCEQRYQVSFPMFAKIDVNGDRTHPLFGWLKQQAPGVMGSRAIKWNFTKFLIDRAGIRVKRFAPMTSPGSMVNVIDEALARSAD